MSLKKNRQAQHRPGREAVVKSKELAEAKRELHRLGKENARLRKKVAKTVASADVFEGPLLVDILPEAVDNLLKSQQSAPTCPNCTIPIVLKIVDLGDKKFFVCPICKYRAKLPAI